jgi:hypothetical protein
MGGGIALERKELGDVGFISMDNHLGDGVKGDH